MSANPPVPMNPGRAALWMIGAILSFSAMAVAGRELASNLDTFEMMTYRSAIGAVIVVTVAGLTGHLQEITPRDLGLHALRNIAHFTGQNLWFFALTLIPLAQVFALEFTSPLWLTLLAPFFLGERLTWLKLGAIAAGFLGVLLVAQPGTTPLSIGTLAAAASALAFAFTGIFTKQLTRRASVTCILFYLTMMQLILGLVTAGIDGDIAWPTRANLPWIAVIGIGGLSAHFCITTALSLAPATIVLPIDFGRLPVIALIGLWLYGEPVNLAVILGALVIFAANYLNISSQGRNRRARDARGL